MIVVDRKRRSGIDARQDRPPVHTPRRHLRDLVVLVAARAAGVLTFPARRVRGRSRVAEEEVPSEERVFNDRLAALDAQNRTMGYLLQASIAKLDMMVHPQPRVTPLQAPRTTIAASLRVKRERHTGPSSIKSHRGVMAAAFVLLVLPALVMATAYGIVLTYEHYSSTYQPPEAIAALDQPIRGARVYDRNGQLLYEFIDDQAGQRFPVDISDISPNLLAATIATEDESFYSNPGVNPRGILRAAWENISPYVTNKKDEALEGSGGSSITQQLVKNIYIPAEERAERSLDRKATEAALSLELTKHYSKDQILQWYLNEISYGSIYHGVEAAAEGYFGVPASQLTLAQAALLAGIPQSPALYDPINRPEAALARRNEVLDLIATNQSIRIGDDTYYAPSQAIIDAAKQEPLGVKAPEYQLDAPHFVLNHVAPQVEALLGHDALYKDGLTITTTLDLNLQHRTQDVLESWIEQYEATSNSHNGAVMVMDNKTGEVLVLIGSRDYNDDSIDGNVDNITALNSPGSSFKPFIYLTSFMKLGWLPSTIIADTPVTYRESDGSIFKPENPIVGSYLGDIPIKTALGNSLNVPPFKTVMQTGVDAVIDVARRAGFTTLDGQYGPSIAIGGVDLTALDLTYGYSVLANNGVMVGVPTTNTYDEGERNLDPVMILKIQDRDGNVLWSADQTRQQEQVVPAEDAYLVTSILTDGQNTCVTFGCGGVTIPGHIAGVKTGTSEPYDPNGPDEGKIGETWAFGYTPDYTVGVWAGNSDNEPVQNLYSTSISFHVMRDTMLAAYNGAGSGDFVRPDGIGDKKVCAGAKCSTELYVKDQNSVDKAPPVVQGQPVDAATAVLGASPPTATPASLAQLQPTATPTAQIPLAPQPTSTPVDATSQPLATLLPPASTSGSVSLEGWAWSPQMRSYRVEFSPAGGGAWSVIAQSSSPVRGGVLGVWRTTGLAPGAYNLRVVVEDASGEYASSPIQVVVSR